MASVRTCSTEFFFWYDSAFLSKSTTHCRFLLRHRAAAALKRTPIQGHSRSRYWQTSTHLLRSRNFSSRSFDSSSSSGCCVRSVESASWYSTSKEPCELSMDDSQLSREIRLELKRCLAAVADVTVNAADELANSMRVLLDDSTRDADGELACACSRRSLMR